MQERNDSRSIRRTPLVIAVVALGFAGYGFASSAQDQSAADTMDVILARKTLMSSIDEGFIELEDMTSRESMNLDDARKNADTISVMLMAFPHLFPPASNRWKDDPDADPIAATIASPDIWDNFGDFYQRAQAASKTAYDISRADTADEVKRLTRALGVACDTCHALYLKE